MYLPAPLFALDTCARCYHYLPDKRDFFAAGAKWKTSKALVGGFNVTHLTGLGVQVTLALRFPPPILLVVRSDGRPIRAGSRWPLIGLRAPAKRDWPTSSRWRHRIRRRLPEKKIRGPLLKIGKTNLLECPNSIQSVVSGVVGTQQPSCTRRIAVFLSESATSY